MRRPLLALAGLLSALPAWASQDVDSFAAQVPLLPLAETGTPDIDALAAEQWPAYWRAAGAGGIGRDDLLAGRIDLDGDGEAELVLMIAADAWEDERGRPVVVAAWRKKAWRAVGFGRGEIDRLFTTREIRSGWRTIDTGRELMRWTGKAYQPETKPE